MLLLLLLVVFTFIFLIGIDYFNHILFNILTKLPLIVGENYKKKKQVNKNNTTSKDNLGT
jgi:hypothetical protein